MTNWTGSLSCCSCLVDEGKAKMLFQGNERRGVVEGPGSSRAMKGEDIERARAQGRHDQEYAVKTLRTTG